MERQAKERRANAGNGETRIRVLRERSDKSMRDQSLEWIQIDSSFALIQFEFHCGDGFEALLI